MDLKYLDGFGNHFASEAKEGALPQGQNSPQICALGLVAEQLNGTAFTVPRAGNQRSWLYRLRPSVGHENFVRISDGHLCANLDVETTPNQTRWMPPPIPSAPTDFIDGLLTVCGGGSIQCKAGCVVHYYVANKDMHDRAFCNADGDMLIVPQQNSLLVTTEFGKLHVPNGFICVVQRGIRFSVALPDGPVRGYICEVFNGHFKIPDLGPIGANGLANPRDFQSPVAWFEDRSCKYQVVHKFMGRMWSAEQDFSPFNVVGWHGNYVPYRYNLALFNTMNSVSFDHPDPSIYTVLTCATGEPGVAACDFVIFPPRWCVQDKTFRPPYFHRNCMSEFMGLIRGTYEAKEGGFVAGGSSLHSCMTAHGPDKKAFEIASTQELNPVKIPDTNLAFMFESTYMFGISPKATDDLLPTDKNYLECWKGITGYPPK